MICTQYDAHIRHLIYDKIAMLWRCKLNNGQEVWSDFERDGFENPWDRLKKHCQDNNLFVVKAEALIMGAPTDTILWEDPDGIDGFYITRGTSKDVAMYDFDSTSYQSVAICVLRDDLTNIDVRKFTWPECQFEPFVQTRLLTKTNYELMLFKNSSEKRKRIENGESSLR